MFLAGSDACHVYEERTTAFVNVTQTKGAIMFTADGGGLDQYLAEISSHELPKDHGAAA